MENVYRKTPIKDWAEDDRPREKMGIKGAAALSDAELLAILIQKGTREKSAVELARDILNNASNNLNKLGKLSLRDFQNVKGIGPAKAITLLAALELGRRRQISEVMELKLIKSSRDAAGILAPVLRDFNNEVFCVLYLNTKCNLIYQEMISVGGINNVTVDIRLILKNAIQHFATQIIVAHNHPSGNLTPSKADKVLTTKINEATKILDIKLCDHIIIAGNKYYSFADEGLL